MKILWITNNIMPYPAKQMNLTSSNFGGWVLSMLEEISKKENIELAIATIYNCDEIMYFNDSKIKYYLIPGKLDSKYHKKTEKHWIKLDKMFSPDIVHLFGSEFYHGLSYINALPNKKIIISIQGLVSSCARNFLGGMTTKEVIDNITFRDILKRDNLFQMQKKYYKRGNFEKELIKKVKYVLGRTEWDYYNTISINPSIKYFKNEENLRLPFLKRKWNIKLINKHSLYVSQASQPLKGFHVLLKALPLVKKTYGDVKIYVGGKNIIKRDTLKDKIKLSGYGKYLLSLIKKYQLQDNIIFLDNLNDEEVVNQLLQSHLFILPSKIENSSNSLAEAMMLGVPCIAAYTGGTPSMVLNEKEGLLYSYDDYEVLAQSIIKLFEDEKLCNYFSKNGRERALIRHDLKTNMNELYNIYDKLK